MVEQFAAAYFSMDTEKLTFVIQNFGRLKNRTFSGFSKL